VTYSKALNCSVEASVPKNTQTIWFSAARASTSSTDDLKTVAGLVFFFNHETIVDSVLPPLYSEAYPSTKNFKVGYPETPNLLAKSLFYVASTLAKGIYPARA